VIKFWHVYNVSPSRIQLITVTSSCSLHRLLYSTNRRNATLESIKDTKHAARIWFPGVSSTVSMYLPFNDSKSNTRLSVAIASEFLSIFWYDDYHFRKNDQRDRNFLPPLDRYRCRVSSKLLGVRPKYDETNSRLDSVAGRTPIVLRMLNSMTQAFLNSPNFDFYESLRPPFGIILFYLYSSIVSICN
jgi:hypothetical protein